MSDKQQVPVVKTPEPVKTPAPVQTPIPTYNSFQPAVDTTAAGMCVMPTPKAQGTTPPVAPTPTAQPWWEKNAAAAGKATPPGPVQPGQAQPAPIDRAAMKSAAAELHRAMDGWGTNEAGVMSALRGKSPAEIAAIRQEFSAHYGQDLDTWINDELGGQDLEEAKALMKADPVEGALAGLQNSVGFWNDDEAKIESLMRDMKPEDLTRLKADPRWAAVSSKVQGNLGGGDKEVFAALTEGDKAKASAVRIDEAMGSSSSWYNITAAGTDEEKIYANLGNLSPDERKAAEAAFNKRMQEKGVKTDLRSELGAELGGADKDRAVASLDNDVATESAAKIEQTMAGLGTDEKTLFAEVEKLKGPEREAALLAYKTKYKVDLSDRLKDDLGGTDLERASMAAEGKQDDTFKLFYGMEGLGTDEQLLKDTLKGKSKEEIDAMRTKWNTDYAKRYGSDFDSAFNGELSGRDNFDVTEIALRGEPKTAAEKKEVMELQYSYERGDRSTWVGRNAMDFADTIGFSSSASVLDMQKQRLDETTDANGKIIAPDSAIDDLYGYVQDDVQDYRAAKDSVTDAVATGAEITVAAIATVATAGSASPILAAVLASALGTVSGMGVKALMQGEAYGIESIGTDALAGALSAGLAGAGETKFLAAQIDELAKAFGPKFAAQVADGIPKAMFEGTVKGTILGGAGGGLGAATNEDNLRGGFGDWAAGVGKGIGGGMFTGGVTGLTGGAMDEYIGTKVDTSSLSGTITKTAAAGATSELTGAVINGSTWEGSGDDIAKRLLGSTLKGGYSGAVGGFGEHRKDKLEAQAEAAKAAAATPAVDAPAVDAPVIAPAVTPAVDVPAVQTPQVTAPSVQTEAQLLDRLIRFENAGGSRALVDFGLGMMNDPVALEQLLSSHGG